jgi:tyrosine-protein kinase
LDRLSRQDVTSLSTYLGVLRRRGWIIAICAIVVPVVAYELSTRQTPEYSSTAQVFVNEQNIAAALTGLDTTAFSSQALAVDTQASLAAVPDVAASALAVSKLHDRSAAQVLGETSITPNDTNNFISFTVTDRSPAVAQILATSYAQAFTRFSNALETKPVVRARQEIEKAMSTLQSNGQKNTAQYATLEAKDQQLETLQTLQTSGATVIRRADLGGQISPHPKRDGAIGLFLGLVLGLGIAFGMEALDTRIRSTGELGENLGGMPLLARLPPPTRKMQKRDELAMVVQPKHNVAEAFRLLRTNLDFVRLSSGDVRTILVTSALEKEGKSTTAANLAVVEARSGRRVALVDLDLRKPYLARFFRLTAAAGVTDVALGKVDLAHALQRIDLQLGGPTENGNRSGQNGHSRPRLAEGGVLDLLVSGILPPDPGEFAASHRLGELLGRLREAYDLVIVDTPPLLWVGDALTLSSHADGLIIVARLKGLRRPMMRELRRLLEAVPTRKLGFVVTGPISGDNGVYGDVDADGYGYGYENDPPPARKAAHDENKLGRAEGLRPSIQVWSGGDEPGEREP